MRERRPDYVFLGLLGAIVALGFVTLTSASGPYAFNKFQDSWWFVKHQALYGLLPGALPVGNRLRTKPRLGIVMREQFGLSVFRLSQSFLQLVSDLLVIVLPGAFEQRLIRGILNQRMLESIGRLRQ